MESSHNTGECGRIELAATPESVAHARWMRGSRNRRASHVATHARCATMSMSHATSRMRVTNPAVEDSSSRSIVVITHALDTSKALPEAGGDKYSAAMSKPGMYAMKLRTVEQYAQICWPNLPNDDVRRLLLDRSRCGSCESTTVVRAMPLKRLMRLADREGQDFLLSWKA